MIARLLHAATRSRVVAPALFAVMLAAAAFAQDKSYLEQLEDWSNRDAEIALEVSQGTMNMEQADAARVELAKRISDARALATRLRTLDNPIEAQLQALGPPPEEGFSESEQVAAQRERLKDELARLQGLATQADAAAARAAVVDDQVSDYRLRIVTARLQDRGPSVLSVETWRRAAEGVSRVLKDDKSDPTVTGPEPAERFTLVTSLQTPGGLVVAAGLIFLGHAWAGRALENSQNPENSQLARIGYGASAIFIRLGSVFLALGLVYLAIRASGAWGAAHLGALERVLWIGVFASFIYGIAGVLFGPNRGDFGLPPVDDKKARAANRYLIWLAVAMALDATMLGWGTFQPTETETLVVANGISLTVIAALFLRLLFAYTKLRVASEAPPSAGAEGTAQEAEAGTVPTGSDASSVSIIQRYAVYAFMVVAIAAPLLAYAGYFALSRYLLIHAIFTATLLAGISAIYRLADAALEAYAARLQELTSSKIGSLGILNLALAALLLFFGAVALAFVWGASFADVGTVMARFGGGIEIGDIRVSPAGILRFLIVLAAIFVATRVVQAFLRGSVLRKTQLDASARDAIVTGTGYAGITLGAVIAASVSGLDLSNLAILAGALSVGIGFGLQTVVSNFVSGIILMVERPIRIGDWIAVSGQQGYVKRISVRSTEIETFDRASYIMPNADLIANPVLNWTLKNPIGRVICPVGVSYDSDVKQVMEILRGIATSHPLVLKRPAPSILLVEFGDSYFSFEIRAFLRDVNYVLSVKSDLNMKIVERFAEEGIEIPFPQRDLHLRSLPPKVTEENVAEIAENPEAVPKPKERE